MKKALLAAVAYVAAIGVTVPAHAQFAVVDVRAIAQHVQTVRNTLQQLQEAQRLYQAFNSISDVRSVSNLLDQPILRDALPEGMRSTVVLVSADLRDLGAIGSRAQSIMANGDFSFAGADAALADLQGGLRKAATIDARNQAYSESMLEATQATGEGLNQLTNGLASATTLRQSQDIAARAAIENAGVNNRILQMMAAENAQRAQAALRAREGFAASQRQQVESATNGSWRPTFTAPQQ